MTYLKPNAFTRKVFNPIAMRLGMGGSTTLVVPRRRTGAAQRIPVIPVEHEGSRYIVSTRGESDWVRNLRAAGGGEIESKGALEAFRAAELPVEQREPIITAYRAKAGKTVETYWNQLPDAADHPVFRVEPAGG
jgi:deazaflavin-dependent oxidoreductase (nitroreductase family)